MSLDERLREGLEGLDTLEGAPPEGVVDAVLGRGRRIGGFGGDGRSGGARRSDRRSRRGADGTRRVAKRGDRRPAAPGAVAVDHDGRRYRLRELVW